MNRKEFEKELSGHLENLPTGEKEKIKVYYEELYYDHKESGKSEEEIVAGWGLPKDAADKILEEYGNSNRFGKGIQKTIEATKEKSKSIFKNRTFWLVYFSAFIITFPLTIVAFSLVIAFFAVALSLFIAFFAMIIAFGISAAACFLGGIAAAGYGVFLMFSSSIPIGLAQIGAAIIVFVLGFVFYYLCKIMLRLVRLLFVKKKNQKKYEGKKMLAKAVVVMAAVLAITGVSLFIGALGTLKWDITALNNTEYERGLTFDSEGVVALSGGIQIDVISHDVIVKGSADNTVHCVYSQNKENPIIIKIENDKLIIKEPWQKWYYNMSLFNWVNNKMNIELYIPASIAGNGSITLVSGDLEMKGITFIENLTVTTTSGNVKIDGITAINTEFKSTSGDYKINNCEFNQTTMKLTSGDITAAGFINTKFTANVTSGDMKLQNFRADDVNISAVSGDVKLWLPNPKSDYKFNLSTMSGDKSIGNGSSAAVNIETKPVKISTLSGDINIYFY